MLVLFQRKLSNYFLHRIVCDIYIYIYIYTYEGPYQRLSTSRGEMTSLIHHSVSMLCARMIRSVFQRYSVHSEGGNMVCQQKRIIFIFQFTHPIHHSPYSLSRIDSSSCPLKTAGIMSICKGQDRQRCSHQSNSLS